MRTLATERYTIRPDDPLSARAEVAWSVRLERAFAMRDLKGGGFAAPRSYQEFPLSQLLDDARTLAFRVGSSMRANLWIDRVRVEFTPGVVPPADHRTGARS